MVGGRWVGGRWVGGRWVGGLSLRGSGNRAVCSCRVVKLNAARGSFRAIVPNYTFTDVQTVVVTSMLGSVYTIKILTARCVQRKDRQ